MEKKYIVSRFNSKFWRAIHEFNSAPLWNCIVKSAWPINPRNNKSKLVIIVKNDTIFKIIANATRLKYATK